MVNYLGDIKGDAFTIWETATTPRNRSVSGYGNKLPTHWMVKFGKRNYRVYAICWAKVASLYVLISGQRYFLHEYDIDN
jgi:hypothetical protein